MQKSFEWLGHIETSIPEEAYGYPVSMYSIALEGWRRGLSLKFRNNFRVKAVLPYTLSGYGREIEFLGVRSELVSKKAIHICMNKEKTKEYLIKSHVATPKGKKFQQEDNNEIIKYAQILGYPLVLKPTDASGGKGVIANIKNETEFIEALEYVRIELKYEKVIVEEFINGKDYRLFVIGDHVIGAFFREPANVVGDGKQTIDQLLKQKKIERTKNPGIYNQVIKLDKETLNLLKSQGYTEKSIPKKGEIVYLKTTSNISTGGDSVDATDDLPSHIKKEAVKAIKAIPGLIQGGVDILYNEENGDFSIIEINSQPSIRAHLFPMQGKARDIPKAIIDYYFPETIGKRNIDYPLYYFDIHTVFSTFQSYITNEISIPNIPTQRTYVKMYTISFRNYINSYGKWVQKQAKVFRLNGYVKNLNSKKVTVLCAGPKQKVFEFEKIIKGKKPYKAKIRSIHEKVRNEENNLPIKVGFEIIDNDTKQSKLKKELSIAKKEIKHYKMIQQEIENSTSWRITKPIRFIGSIKKNLFRRK